MVPAAVSLAGIRRSLAMEQAGLVLGAGTVLARMARTVASPSIGIENE